MPLSLAVPPICSPTRSQQCHRPDGLYHAQPSNQPESARHRRHTVKVPPARRHHDYRDRPASQEARSHHRAHGGGQPPGSGNGSRNHTYITSYLDLRIPTVFLNTPPKKPPLYCPGGGAQ